MIPPKGPPKVSICIIPIFPIRKLRLTGGGYTLLKVTQFVSSRVKIQIRACVNPDAKFFPSAVLLDPAPKGPRASQQVAEITTPGLTC